MAEGHLNKVTAEASKVNESINSNGIAECKTTTYRTLFFVVRILQHETLQPENESAHGICWQIHTIEK